MAAEGSPEMDLRQQQPRELLDRARETRKRLHRHHLRIHIHIPILRPRPAHPHHFPCHREEFPYARGRCFRLGSGNRGIVFHCKVFMLVGVTDHHSGSRSGRRHASERIE
jgi:hypothetical protein